MKTELKSKNLMIINRTNQILVMSITGTACYYSVVSQGSDRYFRVQAALVSGGLAGGCAVRHIV